MTSLKALRAAVFIDRDGTVIEETEYLSDPAGVLILPGAIAGMKALLDAGFPLVLVTNQAGIARGYYTVDDYEAVAVRLSEMLEAEGVQVEGTYFCPHHPDVTGPCDCRKPATGMYRQSAAAHGLDLGRSFYIGDKLSDVIPALELGGLGVLVRTGYGRELEAEVPDAVHVVDDLEEAVGLIVSRSLR